VVSGSSTAPPDRPLPEASSTLGKRYALTSSWSAAVIVPVAPPRLVTCYVDDPEQVASASSLRPADASINVHLVVPFDPVVYERTWERDGLTYVALPQAAADLLNSPGRGPRKRPRCWSGWKNIKMTGSQMGLGRVSREWARNRTGRGNAATTAPPQPLYLRQHDTPYSSGDEPGLLFAIRE
jgi:hypothetical protein